MELSLKASDARITATDYTEPVLICHVRYLFFRSHGRIQALDLRTARPSISKLAPLVIHGKIFALSVNPC